MLRGIPSFTEIEIKTNLLFEKIPNRETSQPLDHTFPYFGRIFFPLAEKIFEIKAKV